MSVEYFNGKGAVFAIRHEYIRLPIWMFSIDLRLDLVKKHQCHDEEKGCSARDFMRIGCCIAEDLVSNDSK